MEKFGRVEHNLIYSNVVFICQFCQCKICNCL